MSEKTVESVLREIVLLFKPLADAVTPPVEAIRFFNDDTGLFEDLPHDPEREMLRLIQHSGVSLNDEAAAVRTAIAGLVGAGLALKPATDGIESGQLPSVNDLRSSMQAIRTAIAAFSAAVDAVQDAPPADEIAAALMEHLVARHLQDRHPALWHPLCLLGVTNAEALTTSQRGQFDAGAIWPALSRPNAQLAATSGWNTDLDHNLLFEHLDGFAEAIGLDVRLIDPPPHPFAPASEREGDLPALTLSLAQIERETDAVNADLNLTAVLAALAADGAAKEGLVAFLHAAGAAELKADIGDTWQIDFSSDLSGTAPIGLVARPGAVRVETADLTASGQVKATAEFGLQDRTEKTWVEIGPLSLKGPPPLVRLIVTAGGTDGLAIEAALEQATLSLSPENADGFLSKLVPKQLDTKVGLTFGYGVSAGFYLQRGGGLSVDIPVGVALGGVLTVLSVRAALEAADALDASATIEQILELGVSGKAKLGPLGVTVEGIGVDLQGGLPNTPGDLKELAASFKPPTGVGITLEAGPVKGGGYISSDPEKGQYIGALSLDVEALGLSAFGILDTKMPDARDGFSLLITVAGRFAPVPLGFGFTLSGLGGLLGLHRDIDIDVLREMTRAGTAGDILAPKDPIGDAPRIARDAGRLFPVTRGQHVFGPSVKLGWGQPKEFVSLDLALTLTLPDPLRLVLLGKVAVAVPDPKIPLVALNMNVFGVIDFSAGMLEAEGRLYDSKIQGLPVVGGFAVLTRWGSAPTLAFSVGGLHPAFEPPPGFPKLPRMGVDLSKGSFQLTIEGYFAITSNSVQLGARAALRAGAAGFTVYGEIGFDALVIFDPFGIDLAIYASAGVRRGQTNICSVRVRGRLTGPGPWHIRGEATIEVLFFDIGIDFSTTIGSAQRQPLTVVQARDLLIPALRDARNWAGAAAATATVLDHMDGRVPPGAQLTVSQKVVPLDLALDKIGPSPLSGARRFTLTGLRLGAARAGVAQTLREPFAPAQYFEMSDADKLSAPGYEPLPSGVRFTGADTVGTGRAARVPSGRAAFIVESTDAQNPDAMRRVRASVVAPRIPDRRRSVRSPNPTGRITVRDETWQATDDALTPAQGTSHAEARAQAGAQETVARASETAA